MSLLGGGRFAIIDGQHRATAALLHPAIREVPCWIVTADDAAQARAFVGINSAVTQMSPIQLYHAGVAAGTPDAAGAEKCAEAAGVFGAATVSAMRFKGIVDGLPEGANVDFAAPPEEEGRAELRSGRSRFRLATLAVKDYPDLMSVTPAVTLALPKGAMKHLLSARWAASYEATRYYLNGLFFHRAGDRLAATATDGHRLAFVPVDLPDAGEGMEDAPHGGAGYIVPNEAVKALVPLVEDRACRLTFSDRAMEAEIEVAGDIGPVTYRSKLVDGTFPDYARVIPARGAHGGEAEIDTARLLQALKACSVALNAVENEKHKPSPGVLLKLSNGVLRVEAKGDFGEAGEDEMDIGWAGGETAFGVNWRYLAAAAEAVDDSLMRLWPGDGGDPMRIEPKTDDGRVFVVMPMRV
ncbi:hypothetical protein [Parvibaculum sp.]|uniref:DNA polymerase III subunit beta family protein n=1 Tax=Parvibaculum sp. TaxID=2024848 RepID=UPI00272FA182|nr:hypothetical protein [Parvibaculum sp.]MDP1628837.1 hypothetical protein [Parvibaculum sp.]MDP2148232.1 hypothetical protein [Parvibaculum sp.]MDP3326654.1 hypothetical protein [Parvibaculum sp.]